MLHMQRSFINELDGLSGAENIDESYLHWYYRHHCGAVFEDKIQYSIEEALDLHTTFP